MGKEASESRAPRRYVRFNQYANMTDTNYTEALFDVARLTAPLVYEQRAASRRVLGCSVVRRYYYQGK